MLEQLQLRDFRCFAELRVDLDTETTALVGRNGQGKTSIIEACCLLLRLQSPRTSNRGEMVRFGQPAAVVEGRWRGGALRCAISATARRLAVNGAVCTRAADYVAVSGAVVWMDHADMNLVRGGAEHRRRFLDFAGSQLFADYLPALRAYERALRGRNHVLKRDAVISWRQADAFAGVLAQHGRVLVERRASLCGLLAGPAATFHEKVGGAVETARLDFKRGYAGDSLTAELLERREEEARTRSTVCGPHRDDLVLTVNELDATRFASEGQQRTLALALKLAQAQVLAEGRGMPPLLLMDDVFGELDRERRRAFLDCLPQGTQKIFTTTRLDWIDAGQKVGRIYEVDRGGVRREA